MKKIIQILLLMMFFSLSLYGLVDDTGKVGDVINSNAKTLQELNNENLRTIIDLQLLGKNGEDSMLSLPLYIATVLLTIFRDYLAIFLGLIISLMAWQKMQGQQWGFVLTNGAGSIGLLLGSVFLTEGSTNKDGNIEDMHKNSYYLVKAEREFIKIGEDIADRLWMTLVLGETYLKEEEYLKTQEINGQLNYGDIENSFFVKKWNEKFEIKNNIDFTIQEKTYEEIRQSLNLVANKLNEEIQFQKSNLANISLFVYFYNAKLFNIQNDKKDAVYERKDFTNKDIEDIWKYLNQDSIKLLEYVFDMKDMKSIAESEWKNTKFLTKINILNNKNEKKELSVPDFLVLSNETKSYLNDQSNKLYELLIEAFHYKKAIYYYIANDFYLNNFYIHLNEIEIFERIKNKYESFINENKYKEKFPKKLINEISAEQISSIVLNFKDIREYYLNSLKTCSFEFRSDKQFYTIHINNKIVLSEKFDSFHQADYIDSLSSKNKCIDSYNQFLVNTKAKIQEMRTITKKGDESFANSILISFLSTYIESIVPGLKKEGVSTSIETNGNSSEETGKQANKTITESESGFASLSTFFKKIGREKTETNDTLQIQEIFLKPILNYTNVKNASTLIEIKGDKLFEMFDYQQQTDFAKNILEYNEAVEKQKQEVVKNLEIKLKSLLENKAISTNNQTRPISWMELGSILGELRDLYTPLASVAMVDIHNQLSIRQREMLNEVGTLELSTDSKKDAIRKAGAELALIETLVDGFLTKKKLNEQSMTPTEKKKWENQGGWKTWGVFAAKTAWKFGSYDVALQLIMVGILYIIPAIFWMLAVLSWYVKTAIIISVLPLATFMLSFVNFQQIKLMILTLVALMLTPIVLVSMYFIIIEITIILPMLINKFLPMLDSGNNLFELAKNTQDSPLQNKFIESIKNIVTDVENFAVSNVAEFFNILELIKLVIEFIVTMILFGYFLKSSEYIQMIIGHSVAIGGEAEASAQKIQQTFKMGI